MNQKAIKALALVQALRDCSRSLRPFLLPITSLAWPSAYHRLLLRKLRVCLLIIYIVPNPDLDVFRWYYSKPAIHF